MFMLNDDAMASSDVVHMTSRYNKKPRPSKKNDDNIKMSEAIGKTLAGMGQAVHSMSYCSMVNVLDSLRRNKLEYLERLLVTEHDNPMKPLYIAKLKVKNKMMEKMMEKM